MPSFAEEEFQAHISFVETAGDPPLVLPPEPLTSPPAPIGSLGPAGALAGRSYRCLISRLEPHVAEPLPAAAGIYYLATDYDVAMADLDYHVNVVSAANILRTGDLIRVGSFIDTNGSTRGVYVVRLTNTGGVGAGDPSDVAGSVVTITMKRVDPNLR